MTSALSVRYAKVDAEMTKICAEYQSDPNAQIIELMMRGWRLLEAHGLAQWSVVHPLRTLTHVRNRGGGMLETSNVPEQVADISDCSFSWHEVAQAAAVKLPGFGTPERDVIESLNEKLVDASMGTLAPVERDHCEVMVISCSHNSAGLKAINAKAKCAVPRISEGGKYSAAKIVGRCPTYEGPINEGLKYFVMENLVEVRHPSFIDLTIEACNVGSSIAKPDTAIQLMQKVHSLASAKIKAKEDCNYEAIRMRMERTKPLHKDMLPAICTFVEKWAGGVDNPRFLNSIVDFVRTQDAPKFPNLTKAVLDRINAMNLGVGKGGRYRAMLIKSLLLHDGLVTNATFASLSKSTSNAYILASRAEAEVTECELAMLKMSKTKGATMGNVNAIIGKMEADVVAYVHGNSKRFQSIADILAFHVEILCAELKIKNKSNFRLGFKPAAQGDVALSTATGMPVTKATGAAPQANVTAAPPMQQLGALGFTNAQLLARVLEDGFAEGVTVMDKSSKEMFVIVAMPDEDGSVVKMTTKKDKRRKVEVSLQRVVDTFIISESCETVHVAIDSSVRKCAERMHSFKRSDRLQRTLWCSIIST